MPESQLTLPLNDRIAASAHKLAVRFTEGADLPARFRRQIDSSVEPRAITKLTQNKDFSDFIDYFILRRDTERCDSDELGGLALLSVAFQREIEKRLR